MFTWEIIVPENAKMMDVTFSELEYYLEKYCKNYLEVIDTAYLVYDMHTMKSILNQIPLLHGWIRDKQDCDDHARRTWFIFRRAFPQVPFGYMHVKRYGGLHAANFFVYRTKMGNLGFTMYEPQTNKISHFVSWKPYLMIV